MNIIVLGAGLVGGPMAIDLADDNEFDVTVVDVNEAALDKLRPFSIETIKADLGDEDKIRSLVAPFDFVISAVPGFMGFRTLRTIIEAGKNVVDIAFFPEDPFELDDLALRRNVTAVVDCGVAPGMAGVLAAHGRARLDRTEELVIYVGGLPLKREWPFEYKAVFSPIDVIEEYTRPARYVENGQVVIRPALSDPEYISFPGIGTLEAFNSDGLRTLIRTMDVPNMKEKTLRYPGHIEKMAVLRESGFFSKEEISIEGGICIRPLDFTARILFPQWELKPGEIDLTVMQVRIGGEKDGEPCTIVFDLLDQPDSASNIHSMARTTGYTATVTLRLLAAGKYSRKGIIAPEMIGLDPECVRFLLDGLGERGVHYRESCQ